MFTRILFVGLVSLLCLGCVKEEAPRDLDSVRISITTEVFSVSYRIRENDQVVETVTYDPTFYDHLDTVVLAERRYTVKGVYDRLAVSGNWVNSVISAPNKIASYSGSKYDPISRQPYAIPALTLWVVEEPIPGEGSITTARIPIPAADAPRNGLGRNWASERAWMGQMVGQFLDVVGPPKLNAEDYVDGVPEARHNQMPLKLNFSDYR